MNLSVFDLFKVGIGPSSSHTVGPMLAAYRFVTELQERAQQDAVARVQVDLYGSLALTGRGHATDRAVLLGLMGERPDLVDPALAGGIVDLIRATGRLRLAGVRAVPFVEERDLLFHEDKSLVFHPNGVRFTAEADDGATLLSETYYSVGGGFVVKEGESTEAVPANPVEFVFTSAAELLAIGRATGLSIAEILMRNERTRRPDAETEAGLDRIWSVMSACIQRGMATSGILPGGLGVKRRAPELYRELNAASTPDPLAVFDWVSLYALAVNEENAAGGRVVTAPTNGAAGVIPAVLGYYFQFQPGATAAGARQFLLTAAAIGMLYKRNASLSAAEVGCQGEVGVACSMAAAGLAAVMGGTNAQIENAAEIGMEHNLGLTCDPVGGLVQVPCIERNTMGAIKAINAARLAVLHGDGTHRITLDEVIETMRQTGADMQAKYKETSLGGLAVNHVEC
ncbi:MAG: L-serine ammonia-lyase [Bacteroidales bacterium]|nr:L-serine ammonia-lyase [Bacteroidales bacterium]